MVINALCLVLSEVETALTPDLLVVRHPWWGTAHQAQCLADILGLQTLVVLPGRGVLPTGEVRVSLKMDLLVDLNFILDVS